MKMSDNKIILTEEQKKALAIGLTKEIPEDRRKALDLFYKDRERAMRIFPQFKEMFDGLIAVSTLNFFQNQKSS